MSKTYTHRKAQRAAASAPKAADPVHAPSFVGGQSSSDLDTLMQAKYQQHFLDNQIPHAEAEADRIAASVSGARTPEEVKSQLGEKMGADFSNVTFHTDSAALKQADAMGARAYTTGSDVYFGSGGFDPSVAAHELVHTVQQGMVGSTMQTTSAPTGGVQMAPKWFNKLRLYHAAKKFDREREKDRRAGFRSDVMSRPDLASRESYLRDIYENGDYGYTNLEVPEMPLRPEDPLHYATHAQHQQYLADMETYNQKRDYYNQNYEPMQAAADADYRKNQNDFFGFRNHWWQFWRTKQGDFQSLAKKFK